MGLLYYFPRSLSILGAVWDLVKYFEGARCCSFPLKSGGFASFRAGLLSGMCFSPNWLVGSPFYLFVWWVSSSQSFILLLVFEFGWTTWFLS